MTLGEARAHVGHGVVYRPRSEYRPWADPPGEQGVIADVGHVWVFVTFGMPGSTPAATDPADLTLLAGRVPGDG